MTQFDITDLTQGQEYKYRVAANNNIATGSYSTNSQPFTLDGKYYSVLHYNVCILYNSTSTSVINNGYCN